MRLWFHPRGFVRFVRRNAVFLKRGSRKNALDLVALDLHRRAQRGEVLRPRQPEHLVREPGRAAARPQSQRVPVELAADHDGGERHGRRHQQAERRALRAQNLPLGDLVAARQGHARVPERLAQRPERDAPGRGRGIVGHINDGALAHRAAGRRARGGVHAVVVAPADGVFAKRLGVGDVVEVVLDDVPRARAGAHVGTGRGRERRREERAGIEPGTSRVEVGSREILRATLRKFPNDVRRRGGRRAARRRGHVQVQSDVPADPEPPTVPRALQNAELLFRVVFYTRIRRRRGPARVLFVLAVLGFQTRELAHLSVQKPE